MRPWTAALLALAAGLVVAVAVGVPVGLLTRSHQPSSGGASSSPSPTSAAASHAMADYRQSLAAMRAATGFHYVANTNGSASQQIVGDAGSSTGSQVITFDANYGSEQFTLLLIGGTVYFQGNAPALEDQLGVPAAKAPGLNAKWITVSVGDGPYNVVQPGITVADQAQEMALVPASTANVTTPSGASAIRITGSVPAQQGAPAGTGHVDVATASHLPIDYESSFTVGGVTVTSTTTFSGWGTVPSVSAPSGAIAWSTLGASEPPGGYGSGGAAQGSSPTPQGSL